MKKEALARLLILAGIVLLLLLFAWEAFSEELTIVEMRSNIPLSDKDPIYHDYYINSGLSQGLKQNLIVTASRKVTVHDATGTQSYGDMLVPMGHLKIIYVGEKFAIARETKAISRDENPMVEQTGIMIGDKIELKNSVVDNHKLPRPKNLQEIESEYELANDTKSLEKPTIKPEIKAEAKAQTPTPEQKPETAKTETKPDAAKSETKPETAKSTVKKDENSTAKTENNTEKGPELKPSVTPEAKSEAKPEGEVDKTAATDKTSL